jgi:hypothetical protein
MTMPEIKEVRDRQSESVPSLAESRESQRIGGQTGLPENASKLNEAQGHDVDIKE